MQTAPLIPSKPVSRVWRPELARLPPLTRGRRLFRHLGRSLARLLLFVCTRRTVSGLENIPSKGPALIVINHLGDADTLLILASLPIFTEVLAKIELYYLPLVGLLMHAYGVIWVHRGQPDRRAIEVALEAFHQGRFVGLAPEGRESLAGALEAGTEGAAFLALKAGAPVVPVTLTGTENRRIYGNLKRLRRTPLTLTVGRPFTLPQPVSSRNSDRREAIQEGTRLIMETLARLLPPEYRGVYSYVGEKKPGCDEVKVWLGR